MNSIPLLIAGAAAVVLLGGKKKTKKKEPADTDSGAINTDELPPLLGTDTEIDQGSGPEKAFGAVASGVRKDRRGHVPWRIYQDSEGFHAQIMVTDTRFSPVAEEIGIGATIRAAKKMLREHFNELLLSKYPEEKPKNEPPDLVRVSIIKAK